VEIFHYWIPVTVEMAKPVYSWIMEKIDKKEY
jgi:hypothetical protein